MKSSTEQVVAFPKIKGAGRKLPSAPKTLEKPERLLWAKIVADFSFDDSALAILSAGLHAHQRMRRCRETIDADGETTRDRFGQLRAHPLMQAERDSRSGFVQALRALRIDDVPATEE